MTKEERQKSIDFEIDIFIFLSSDKVLEKSNLIAFAENKINAIYKNQFDLVREENIVGKGGNTGSTEQYRLFNFPRFSKYQTSKV